MKDEETKLQHVTFGLKLSFFLLPSSFSIRCDFLKIFWRGNRARDG